jgi:UDP-N-acetylmuramate--L-alanine ligase
MPSGGREWYNKAMRIYFSGIGGVGIGPLAEIAHDAGYDVCGSDRSASPLTAALMERGVHIALDQSGTFLQEEHDKQPFDWFVYTAALPADHPELVLAHKLGIKTGKRDELLAHIISDKNLKLVAVAGTHGKTTTTSMIVWTLQHLGIPVSYSVGSTLSFGPSGKFDPTSQFFVYECDEFDRNFLNFQPWLSLITSVDYDHPDTYPTEDEYLAAFRTFGHQSDSVIAWQETAACFDDHNVQVLTEYNPDIHLAGEHNRRNGMLALEAVKHMTEIDEASIITSINQFPGAGRRFEKLAEGLYSDYGHHPVEIKATLQLAQELSSHVVLVYQPHQNVRQHEIIAQYTADIFEAAEEIYWLPTYLTRENSGLPILSPQELTRHIVASRPDCVTFAELDDALWDHITAALDAGKLVLCMGAGTIDHWVRQRAATLDA